MAQKYELVLETLRRLDSEKAEEAEKAFEEEKTWLMEAFAELRKKLSSCKKPFRREEKENVVSQKQPIASKGTRRRREALATLDTVMEEEEAADEEGGQAEAGAEEPQAVEVKKEASNRDSLPGVSQPSPAPEPATRGRGRKPQAGRPPKPRPPAKKAAIKTEAAPTTGRVTRSRVKAAVATDGPEQAFPSPPKTRKTRSKKAKLQPDPTPEALPSIKEEQDEDPVAPAAEEAGNAEMDPPASASSEEGPKSGKVSSPAEVQDAAQQAAAVSERPSSSDAEPGISAEQILAAQEEAVAAVAEAQPEAQINRHSAAGMGATSSTVSTGAELVSPRQVAPVGRRSSMMISRRSSLRPRTRQSAAAERTLSQEHKPAPRRSTKPISQERRSQTAQPPEDAQLPALEATATQATPPIQSASRMDESLAANPAERPALASQTPNAATDEDVALDAVPGQQMFVEPSAVTASPLQAASPVESLPPVSMLEDRQQRQPLAGTSTPQVEAQEAEDEDVFKGQALESQVCIPESPDIPPQPEDHDYAEVIDSPQEKSKTELKDSLGPSLVAEEPEARGIDQDNEQLQQSSLEGVPLSIAPAVADVGPSDLDRSKEPQPRHKEGHHSTKEPAKLPTKQPVALPHGPNLVTSHRSLIPPKAAAPALQAAGKRGAEVDALKAAEAARRKEQQREAEKERQREVLRKQKAERAKHAQQVKAKQEEAQKRAAEEKKRREEAMKRKEDEAANRRRQREEAEKAEREEKQRRLEESKAKRRQEEQRKLEEKKAESRKHPRDAPGPSNQKHAQDGNDAKRPKVEEIFAKAKALMAPIKAAAPASGQAGSSSQAKEQDDSAPTSSSLFHERTLAAAAAPQEAAESIEIAPYRSDGESDEDDDEQEIPAWAQDANLRREIRAQQKLDPDELFQQHEKTCPLDEVFASLRSVNGNQRDLNRRTSTGNWFEDRVTWKEEMNYKKAMGYL